MSYIGPICVKAAMRVQILPLERFSHRKLIEGLAPIIIQQLDPRLGTMMG
jgi:hypothetical protein